MLKELKTVPKQIKRYVKSSPRLNAESILQILNSGKDKGWKTASGVKGTVFYNPNLKIASKFFREDRAYELWIKYTKQNVGNPYVPKINATIPLRNNFIYCRLEYLLPLSGDNLDFVIGLTNLLDAFFYNFQFAAYVDSGFEFIMLLKTLYDGYIQKTSGKNFNPQIILRGLGIPESILIHEKKIIERLSNKENFRFFDLLAKDGNFRKVIIDIIDMAMVNGISLDMHQGNVMQRENGQIVFTDPVIDDLSGSQVIPNIIPDNKNLSRDMIDAFPNIVSSNKNE